MAKKYSENPDDWVRTCNECNKQYKCKNYNSYAKYSKMAEEGKHIRCNACAQTGKVMDEAFREKCRNKKVSEETRKKLGDATRVRYAKMSQKEKDEVSIKHTLGNLKAWNNYNPEERERRLRKKDEAMKSLSEDKKKQRNKKISEKVIDRMEANGGLHKKFAPAHNPATISYIVDILNVKYNTEFKHAKSDGGEFKIYDKELRKFYYADAYCAENNIWVEFDEPWKFNKGVMREEHELREQRIKLLLDPMLLRINFNKKLLK